MRRILVVGGGFAGMWGALSAMRTLQQHGAEAETEVLLVSKDGYLTNRPRLYEAPSESMRIPLDAVLGPVSVKRLEAEVTYIDTERRTVTAGGRTITYDRLLLAAGSRLHRPPISGLDQHGHAIDTWVEAQALDRHLAALPSRTAPGRWTAVVVGGGATGVELATALGARQRRLAEPLGEAAQVRVILVERGPRALPFLQGEAASVVAEALRATGVELRAGCAVAAVSEEGATLADGELLRAATVVWTGGARASDLARFLPVETDAFGRVAAEPTLQAAGVPGVFVAGDMARVATDGRHVAPMTCQHAIPQGKIAGHNAACDLLGLDLLAYEHQQRVFCVDLGPWGGLVTDGWDFKVIHTRRPAGQFKELIVHHLIEPPRSSNASDILEAADPEAFLRTDRASQKGVGKWSLAKIPPAIGLCYFRWRTAWSAAFRTPRT